jgi:hypothetical protein
LPLPTEPQLKGERDLRSQPAQCDPGQAWAQRQRCFLTPELQSPWLCTGPPTSGRPMGPPSLAATLIQGVPGSVTECGATCESCFSQDFCIRCKRRFYLYKGKCLAACPPGTLTHQSTQECQGEWGPPWCGLACTPRSRGLGRGQETGKPSTRCRDGRPKPTMLGPQGPPLTH